MKALVILIAAFLGLSAPAFSQQSTSGGTNSSQQSPGQTDTKNKKAQKAEDDQIELRQDPRKALGSRPVVVMPSGKVCKDSLLREINGMDIPNQGQFSNPDNPNGYNDGNLNNNNGELPQRMNCNAINDIAPRTESPDNPLNEGNPVMKEPE
jgi:hypothetical protein